MTIPGGILGNFHERFELWKIRGYRSIELIELDLEPDWNTWNMFLNESWLDLVGRFDPFYSILGISRERFGLWKIQIHRSIELIELHLEPGWNTWNMLLNESWQDLVGKLNRSLSKTAVFWEFSTNGLGCGKSKFAVR